MANVIDRGYKVLELTSNCIFIRISSGVYDVYAPKLVNNGIISTICPSLTKMTVNLNTSPPTVSAPTFFNIQNATKYATPVIPHRGQIGYDYHSDQLLMCISEWDGVHAYVNVTKVDTLQLIGISPDFSRASLLHPNVFSLVEGKSGVDQIRYYAHCWGYGGQYCMAVGTFAGNAERSFIITCMDDVWTATEANTKHNYIQELVEPYWDGSTFRGWLTEGHGTNTVEVRYPTQVITQEAVGGLFTLQPTYDMRHNHVVWTEWGSGIGSPQHIWTAPVTDVFKGTRQTPPDTTIQDREGNHINLATMMKPTQGFFHHQAQYWLIFHVYRGGLSQGVQRIVKCTADKYRSALEYAVIARNYGSVQLPSYGPCRTIDPQHDMLYPNPIVIV